MQACARGTDFPDPTATGGINLGIQVVVAPAYKAAAKACVKLQPFPNPGSAHPSAQQIEVMTRIAVCMRAHGVSGFPDPTTSMPSHPNPAGYSILEFRGGVGWAVPSTINVSSPAFQAAAKTCGFS